MEEQMHVFVGSRRTLGVVGRLLATFLIVAALGGFMRAAPANAGSPPTPVDDSYSVGHTGTLDVAAPGVLSNDLLPIGPTWEAIVVSPPAIGAFNLDANGHLTYTPDPNYVGIVQFTYSVFDGSTAGDPVYYGPATVTIEVTNQLPAPADDAYSTNQDTELDVAAAGVLSNDISPDGDAIEVFGIFVDPIHGTVTIHPDGSFEYVPNAGFFGVDTFEYEVIDSFLLAQAEVQPAGAAPKKPIATVTITVIEPTPTPIPTDTATPESTSTIIPTEPTEAATETPAEPTATTAAPTPTTDTTGDVTELPNTGSGTSGGNQGELLFAAIFLAALAGMGLCIRRMTRRSA
jgi:large repetitive protein